MRFAAARAAFEQRRSAGQAHHARGIVEHENQVRRRVTSGLAPAQQRPTGDRSEKQDDGHPNERQEPVPDPHRSRVPSFGALQVPERGERNPSPRLPPHQVQEEGDGGERDEPEGPGMKNVHASRARFSRYWPRPEFIGVSVVST